MDCTICSVPFLSRGQPTCASCARAIIYEARLGHLTDLLAKETLHKTVATIITPPSQLDVALLPTGPSYVDITESNRKHQYQRVLSETEASDDRVQLINQQLQLLRSNIDAAKADKAARKNAFKQRRIDMSSETDLLHARMPELIDPLQHSIKQLRRKLDKIHLRTREGRAKLCQETARLAGLQQRRRRAPDGQIIEDYIIGRVPIPDLRNLNSTLPHRLLAHAVADPLPAARHEHVSAALSNICRLLITCCHYLSVRLPAEIIPPHVNCPHPIIFSVQSSYSGIELPFAPSGPSSNTSTQSPSASRTLSKLRILHLDKPLVRLAKEDPSRYNLFVEGISLLAWDIAWLCRSQGITTINSWEDVCQAGKNLFLLLRAQPTMTTNHGVLDAEDQKPSGPLAPPFGELSHAAVTTNIEGPVGFALLRGWRFASPYRLIDHVKSHLLTDMSGAEWELIAEEEWDVERDDERAVLVGGRRPTDRDSVPASPVIAASASTGVGGGERNVNVERASNHGWLKLKSRGSEPF